MTKVQMTTSVSAADLITSCPAPISATSQKTVTDGIYWFELVSAWCIVKTDADVPNKTGMKNKCDAFSADTKLNTSDYDSLNNNLMHIKGMLQALIELAGN